MLLDLGGRHLGVVVLVEVDDGHVGTLHGEVDRDGSADPAIAAGDERHLALELAGGLVLLALISGGRLEFALAARLLVLVLGRALLALVWHGSRSLLGLLRSDRRAWFA